MSGKINGAGSKSGIIGYTETSFGNWTPTVTAGGSSITATVASWVRVGNIVTIVCYAGAIGSGTGTQLQWGGLPFNVITGGYVSALVGMGSQTTGYLTYVRTQSNSKNLIFWQGDAGTRSAYPGNGGAGHFTFSLSYRTDE